MYVDTDSLPLSVTFAQESNTGTITTAVSVTLVAIVAIGFVTAIKGYVDKVRDTES